MSLVTLIKSADTSLRDAVVQVEEYALPKEAKFTGKVDADGRAVFTLLETEAEKVEAEVKKEVEPVVTDGESEAEKLLHEVEGEFKAIEEKVIGVFKKKKS